MLEEYVSSEVLVEVQESILWCLFFNRNTSPCCWNRSMWNRIYNLVNQLAIGAMILPKMVLCMKTQWFTS